MADYIVAKKMSTIALTGGRAFFVPAGLTRRVIMSEAISLKTEISYEDLVSAYAPIWDASQFIENAVRVIDRKNDDGFAAKFFGEIQG